MIQNVSLLDPSGIWGIKGAASGFHIFSNYLEVIFECTLRANYVLQKYHRYVKTRFNSFQTFAENT